VDREAVAKLVETAILSLSSDEDETWRPAARRLYDLLIKPIEGELKPGSLLAVVPDGALRGLPFSVLLDADNHYLIEKTRVTVARRWPIRRPAARGAAPATGGRLAREGSEPAGRLLRQAGGHRRRGEAGRRRRRQAHRAHLGDRELPQVRPDQALTREQVDVLHLATHASFNGRSDRAFIVADGEVILLSELRQILSANRTRGGELDLLVL
jgi:CHAT domain-containing protein